VVPLSDGADVVSAIGSGVEGFAIGDRVVIGFMPGWAEGEFSEAKKASSLGGPGVDGVLAAQIAVPATGVVRLPDLVSFEAASTLLCAGVTAWSALFERRPSSRARPCCCWVRAVYRSLRCSWRSWRGRA
jgi:NADPH:quinone reductase-like Zn-dependent oxidoreductase